MKKIKLTKDQSNAILLFVAVLDWENIRRIKNKKETEEWFLNMIEEVLNKELCPPSAQSAALKEKN